MRRGILLTVLLGMAGYAAIIDRTAIVVDRKPILDSDIVRDIRVTAFLNHEKPDFSAASRKAAASRLIDQELIRQQMRTGAYPVASQQEVDQLLNQAKASRTAAGGSFTRALAEYGISEPEFRDRLAWQATVLHFIDIRFRPQVVLSDQDIENYYKANRARFGSRPLAEVRSEINETITGEQINKLLDDWLKEARKSAHIDYLERSLA